MIRKLNFSKASIFDIPKAVVFIRPLGSALSRVYKLPEGHLPSKEIEVEQVLNTLCKRKHNDIWYFDLRDNETQQEVEDIFSLMEVLCIDVKLDNIPRNSN